MANNPYVNKVQYGNSTLIDLTSDTVTADKLMQGYTAHDRTGAVITGTVTFATYYTGSTNPASSLGSNGDIYLKVVS